MNDGGAHKKDDRNQGERERQVWPERVQLVINTQRLREQRFSDAEVVAFWGKAVESAGDALLAGMSVDGALRSAYDAGHMAALALLALRQLRTGSGQGHHEMAFYAAAAFGDAGLEDMVADSEEVRRLRRGSMYDPVIAGEKERTMALAWMRKTLPAIRDALVKTKPALEASLAAFCC